MTKTTGLYTAACLPVCLRPRPPPLSRQAGQKLKGTDGGTNACKPGSLGRTIWTGITLQLSREEKKPGSQKRGDEPLIGSTPDSRPMGRLPGAGLR